MFECDFVGYTQPFEIRGHISQRVEVDCGRIYTTFRDLEKRLGGFAARSSPVCQKYLKLGEAWSSAAISNL